MLPIPCFTPAKITVPQLPREFVVRARLRADLEAANPAGVGLVCAPAGYGKTLLLADWALNSTAADVAWVGLDCDDNDPKRLWASVIAAIAACPSVPSDIRLQAPWVLRPADQPEFLAELGLVLQRLPRPITLILTTCTNWSTGRSWTVSRSSCATASPRFSSSSPAVSTRPWHCGGCV